MYSSMQHKNGLYPVTPAGRYQPNNSPYGMGQTPAETEFIGMDQVNQHYPTTPGPMYAVPQHPQGTGSMYAGDHPMNRIPEGPQHRVVPIEQPRQGQPHPRLLANDHDMRNHLIGQSSRGPIFESCQCLGFVRDRQGHSRSSNQDQASMALNTLSQMPQHPRRKHDSITDRDPPISPMIRPRDRVDRHHSSRSSPRPSSQRHDSSRTRYSESNIRYHHSVHRHDTTSIRRPLSSHHRHQRHHKLEPNRECIVEETSYRWKHVSTHSRSPR